MRSTIIRHALQQITRRDIARILSTFLCCLAIVVRPFSVFGGSAAFLVLALKELIFSVQETIAQHLEATILNIMGALLSIALSTLAKWLATLPRFDSINSRVIPAAFLVLISFLAGWVKSRLPRLQMSMRIACFVSIWLLTMNIGDHDRVTRDSRDFLWITLVPAVLSLFASLLVLRWTSTTFGEQVADSFSFFHDCLSTNLQVLLDDSGPGTYSEGEDTDRRQKLLKKSIALNAAYSQAAFELRIGRLNVKTMKPYVGIVEHLRRELAWGISNSNSSLYRRHESKGYQPLHRPARELGDAILASTTTVQCIVKMAFHRSIRAHDFTPEKNAILVAKEAISAARGTALGELAKLFEQDDPNGDLRDEASDLCLGVISLLQMAVELQQALLVATRIIALYESSSPRLWFPKLSLAWLGRPPKAVILDDWDMSTIVHRPGSEMSLSSEEARQGIAERTSTLPRSATGRLEMYEDYQDKPKRNSFKNIPQFFRHAWSHPSTLRARLLLSKAFRSVQHSHHIHHALKNAAGVALLSVPAFLPRDSTSLKQWNSIHAQWMVITYVWVLEVNTGATFRTAYLRLSGTIIGALYAYIVTLIFMTNPYGLVLMITLLDIPVTWLITDTTIPSMGTVINVTVAPIAFTKYIVTNMKTSVIWLVAARSLMISAGILVALFMNSVFFPQHCRVLFLSGAGRTLSLLSQLYLSLSRVMCRGNSDDPSDPQDKRESLRRELQARESLYQLSVLTVAMNDELSLIPKPVQKYRHVVVLLQQLLDILTGLRKVQENIPREEAVTKVFLERREFISAVCITLFACEHAFRGRQPIPQFLPSARQALRTLEQKVRESFKQKQAEMRTDNRSMVLSPVYAFVEGELMQAMVDVLDETAEVCRSLFGSSDWLQVDRRGTSTITLDNNSMYEVESGLGAEGWRI